MPISHITVFLPNPRTNGTEPDGGTQAGLGSLYQDIRILQQIVGYLSDIWGKNIGYFQP
jgi:hypothetical protein